MNKGNYLRKKINDLILSGISFVPPSSLYVHLYTAAPTASGGGTELNGNGYAAKQVAMSTVLFPAATSVGVTTLAGTIDCGTATGGDWGTIVAVAFKDSDGNLLYFAELETPIAVAENEAFSFRTGDLIWTES